MSFSYMRDCNDPEVMRFNVCIELGEQVSQGQTARFFITNEVKRFFKNEAWKRRVKDFGDRVWDFPEADPLQVLMSNSGEGGCGVQDFNILLQLCAHDREAVDLLMSIKPDAVRPAYQPIGANLAIDKITKHPDLQSRVQINNDTVEHYADLINQGVGFDAIDVFYDSGTYWVVDGFHRLAAHEKAGKKEIAAVLHSGTFADALKFSLSVNNRHGLPRKLDDVRRAYEIAIRHNLVDPADAKAVTYLLRCSQRWARDLTKAARDEATAQRNTEIQRLADEGKSQREIAAVVGVDHSTVQRNLGAKTNTSFLHQEPAEKSSQTKSAPVREKTETAAPPTESAIKESTPTVQPKNEQPATKPAPPSESPPPKATADKPSDPPPSTAAAEPDAPPLDSDDGDDAPTDEVVSQADPVTELVAKLQANYSDEFLKELRDALVALFEVAP